MPGLSHSMIPPLRYIHTEFQYRLPADFEFLNSRCRTRNQIREFKKLAAVDKTGAARWLKFCATGGATCAGTGLVSLFFRVGRAQVLAPTRPFEWVSQAARAVLMLHPDLQPADSSWRRPRDFLPHPTFTRPTEAWDRDPDGQHFYNFL
eukprot:COSAG02_NODE_848_length_16553_cov_21.228577_7_plen_149_part_00